MLKLTAMVVCAIVTLLTFSQPAEARRGAVSYTSGLYVTNIAELPAVPNAGSNRQLKLGWRHERFAVFGIPFWGTTKGSYVIYTDAGDGWRMFPVNAEQLATLGQEMGRDFSAKSPVSILSIAWGWLIVIPILLLGLSSKRSKKNQRAAAPAKEADVERMIAAAHERAKAEAAASPMPRTNAGLGQASAPTGFGKRRASPMAR